MSFYGRYIPPSDATASDERPKKKTKLESNALTSNEKKEKKQKILKSKNKKAENQDERTSNRDEVTLQVEETGEAMVLDEPTTSNLPDRDGKEGKRKKKKKPKIERVDDEHRSSSSEDDTKRRHKSVFAKKKKSMKAPESTDKNALDNDIIQMEEASSAEKAHGLQPLPQPAPITANDSEPDYVAPPSWISQPIRVARQASVPFTDLGTVPQSNYRPRDQVVHKCVPSEVATKLSEKGYKNAFAIQTAVLPQLFPNMDRAMHSDIVVSASTGSGKTLAYVLPIVRDLCSFGRYRWREDEPQRMRAVIVVPTRELVKQVQKVCEDCADAFAGYGEKNRENKRVTVGVAMGSRQLQKEQEAIIRKFERYNPQAWEEREKRKKARKERLRKYRYDPEEWADNSDEEERNRIRNREDEIPTLMKWIIDYRSYAEILICTPGRLVDHIKFTPGFTMEYVRWLVVDEADKLLAQDYQEWLDVVLPKVRLANPNYIVDPVNQNRCHNDTWLVRCRKVILSATMTRDQDLKRQLELWRPKLIVLEGVDDEKDVLPESLLESAIKVDSSLKPLFLLDLLQSPHIMGPNLPKAKADKGLFDEASSSDSDTDSDSDSDSDSDTGSDPKPSVLIFTNSNESALRLSRLLAILSPTLSSWLDTLTSVTPFARRQKILKDFSNGKLRIIIASDLVARGMDLPSLDHVINYDMPRSIPSYIHRGGRTARAGKSGHAWTMFTNSDAGWFWNEVAKGPIQRSRKVERVLITDRKDPNFGKRKAAYEEALEVLEKEVHKRESLLGW